MPQQNFNASLIWKIRRKPVDCPVLERQRLFNVCFSQYAGPNKEMPAIISAVASKLVQSQVRNQLLIKTQKEDIPACSRLSVLVNTLLCLSAVAIEEEPCTAAYCIRLMPELRYLLLLGTMRQEKAQQLLTKLRSGGATYSEDIDDFLESMDYFQDELENCYKVYKYFCHSELNNCDDNGKAPVKRRSAVEQYLVKLFDLLETVIVNTKHLVGKLETWQTQLIRQEREEIYN